MPRGDGRRDEQAPPMPGLRDVSAESRRVLVELLERRQSVGLQRYGRPLETWNGRDAVRDLLEELIDALQYAVQVRMELDDRDAELAHCRDHIVALQAELACLRLQYAPQPQWIEPL
jgi:hypothetical protein